MVGPETIDIWKSREGELLPRQTKSAKAQLSTAAERLCLAQSGWRTAS
jgi:hypothetical protein